MGPVRYVGVDLAWKDIAGRERTAVAAMDEGGHVLTVGRAGTDDEIIECVLAAGRPAMVGIDAPLHIPNQGGCRPCERALIRHGVPVFAANRVFFHDHFGGCRGERVTERLRQLGYVFTDGTPPLPPDGSVIEVYPYTFWRTLFDVVPPYKRGRRQPRLEALAAVTRALLGTLPARPSDAAMGAIAPSGLSAMDGRGLDLVGDALDSVAAALTMHTLDRSGVGEDGPTKVFGDIEEGCILASWPPRVMRRAG